MNNYSGPTRSQMLDALINGKNPVSKVYGQEAYDTQRVNHVGGGYPFDTVTKVTSDGSTVTVVHADGSVNTFATGGATQASEQATTDHFTSASSVRALAAAVKRGTAKVVFVGDSLLFGWQAAAQASAMEQFARRISQLFQSCTFTFLDRSIPGGRFSDFLNVAFHPADSFAIGTASAPGTPGRDVYSVGATEELTRRWPEGAANIAATSWQDVVKNDVPDLIVFALGFNDINAGGDTIALQKTNYINFNAYLNNVVSSTTTKPAVILVTEHSGNPAFFLPTAITDDRLRGLGQLTRAVARFYDWGLWDAGRAYDKYVRGTDPTKFKFDVDRYMDGFMSTDNGSPSQSNSLWQLDRLNGSWTGGLPISGQGTSGVTIDTTGKYSVGGSANFVRKLAVGAASCHFNLRKLATDNDILTVTFGNIRDGSNTLLDTNKLQVRMFNQAGVGKVQLSYDGVLTTANVAVFPTTDVADYWVEVIYDSKNVNVYLNANTNPNVPSVSFALFPHQPTWPSIGYENTVGPPVVKVKQIVFLTAVEAPTGTPPLSAAAAFGVGPVGEYFTNNRSLGGDAAFHHSSLGYLLFYGDTLGPVLDAVKQSVSSLATTFQQFNASTQADYTMDGAVIGINTAGLSQFTLPGASALVAFKKLYVGYTVEVFKAGVGNVQIVSSGGDSVIEGDQGATILTNLYRTARCILIGATATTYTWLVVQGGSEVQIGPTNQSVYLGAFNDGNGNIVASATNAVLMTGQSANGWTVFVDTGLTPGSNYAVTQRLNVDTVGRLSGKNLHDNATLPSGTTNQYIASGTYTPTLFATTNLTAATIAQGTWQWMRVGNVVTVSGVVTVQTTAGAPTNTLLGISLPLASNIGATGISDLAGCATISTLTPAQGNAAGVFGDVANDRATMRWQSGLASAGQIWSVHFTYTIA